jgi:hypothetical protein
MSLLPPVIATLIADTKEYQAKMTEAQAKMSAFGKETMSTSEKMKAFGSKAASAVIGVGVALGVYATHEAYKFQEALDKVQNQAGLTVKQTEELGKSIKEISNVTGVTNEKLLEAALITKQAGLNAAQANDLLTASAKASVITNSSVVDVTKAIVAAQTLQITKGMEVADLTGVLVKGSYAFVGGLQAEEAMLSGKIGVSLAKYGLGLKAIIPLGAEFSKIGLPTKSVVAFTKSLGLITAPVKDAKGHLTSYAKTLIHLGLSQQKLASYMRSGDIVGLLGSIKSAAGGNVAKEGILTSAVFGSAGSGAALAVLKDYNAYLKESKNLTGAGAGTLTSGFEEALKQIGPQLDVVKANFNNLMINAGTLLLPTVAKIASWASSFAAELNKNKALRDVLGIGAGAAFGLAVASKIKKGIESVMGLFGKGAQVAATNANTLALEANTIALGGSAAGGAAGGLGKTIKKLLPGAAGAAVIGAEATGAAVALPVVVSAVIAAGITYGLWKAITGPHSGPLTTANAGMSLSGGRGASLGYGANGKRTTVNVTVKPRGK